MRERLQTFVQHSRTLRDQTAGVMDSPLTSVYQISSHYLILKVSLNCHQNLQQARQRDVTDPNETERGTDRIRTLTVRRTRRRQRKRGEDKMIKG